MRVQPLQLLAIFLVLTSSTASATVRYVNANGSNPIAPYADWSTAATNIQDAIAVASVGDLVLVTNGIYSGGGWAINSAGNATNRVAVTQPLTVQSVNGPSVTLIQGVPTPSSNPVRCVYLTNNASLVGFTLTNGGGSFGAGHGPPPPWNDAGGVWCESLSAIVSNCLIINNVAFGNSGGAHKGTLVNCILTGNSGDLGAGAYGSALNNCVISSNSVGVNYGGGVALCSLTNCTLAGNFAGYGGAAYECSLNNCLVISNAATQFGGGVLDCSLQNCTVVGNVAAYDGGGVFAGGTVNCIVYYNSAPSSPNYDLDVGETFATLDYCCTTPLPPAGAGNITNEPAFVDLVGGNLHLQTNSPSINSGKNAYAAETNDFDGNPRIVGGTVDIGAYEFQTPTSIISYAWLQQYGLAIDGSADYIDTDGDSMNNWQEWICGTDPTNPLSVLKMLSPARGAVGIAVPWQTVTNRSYFFQRATNLTAQPSFLTLATNIGGQFGSTTFTDTNATGPGPFFFRVGIQR